MFNKSLRESLEELFKIDNDKHQFF